MTALFFCIGVSFSMLLSASRLEKFTQENIFDIYNSTQLQLQTTIERGLKFGRPLQGYTNLKLQLSAVQEQVEDIENIVVYDKDGNKISSVFPVTPELFNTAKRGYSPELYYHPKNDSSAIFANWTFANEAWLKLVPLHGRGHEFEGYLLFSIAKKAFTAPYERFLEQMFLLVAVLAFMASIASSGWGAYFSHAYANNPPKLRSVLRNTLFIVVGGTQLIFIAIMFFSLSQELDRSTRYSAKISGTFFAHNLEFLLHKKVNLQTIYGLENHLSSLLQSNKVLQGISLHTVNSAKKEIVVGSIPKIDNSIVLAIHSYWADRYTPYRVSATLKLFPDPTFWYSALKKLALDQGTVLLISFLLLFEMAKFATNIIIRSPSTTENKDTSANAVENNSIHASIIMRAIMFLFFFGYDMAMSFIPLAAAELKGSIPFIDPSILSALPISLEAFFAGVGIFITGTLASRLGSNTLLRIGLCSAIMGAVLAALSDHIALFMLARSCSGLGFGILLMAGQLSVINTSSGQANGLAEIFAGLFAGSICGSALGAIAYDILGMNQIFWCSTCKC